MKLSTRCTLWGLSGGAGQGHSLLVFHLVPPSMSYKVICRWLPLVLGLELPRTGKFVNQDQLLIVLGLRPLSKRYRACWGQMLVVSEFIVKSEAWVKTGLCMKKPLEKAWMGPQAGWSEVSGNHQSEANRVGQVNGVSDMEPACRLCGGRAHQGTMASASTFVWQNSALLSSRPGAGHFSSSPYVPVDVWTAAQAMELRVTESK